MKTGILIGSLIGALITIVLFNFVWPNIKSNKASLPELITTPLRPLDKYTFENMKKKKFAPVTFKLDKNLKRDDEFDSYLFYFYPDGKKISGQINIPKEPGIYPVIVMFRGYIDSDIYRTGDGTRRAAEQFARAGLITIAPDFLGYGESDKESSDPMEARFQTYAAALTLLSAFSNLDKVLPSGVNIDSDRIGIWGHSNGGQVAITTLEISGEDYPTVLWAPVTKPFPYSVLYYTDEAEDRGKYLRRVIADFEKDYDVEKYSLTNYLSSIDAPIELHQGSADESVPQKWSDEFAKNLESHDVEIEYFVYPRDDHNFARGNWSTVVNRNIEFYKRKLQKP